MKQKIILIFIIIIAIICCGSGIFLLTRTKSNKTTSKGITVEKIDHRDEEEQIKKATNNQYYEIGDSVKFTEDRTYGMLEVKYIRLVRVGKETYSFTCQLVNNTNKTYPSEKVVINFLDENGKSIEKLDTSINDIPENQTTMISVHTTKNIIGAYDFEIIKQGK